MDKLKKKNGNGLVGSTRKKIKEAEFSSVKKEERERRERQIAEASERVKKKKKEGK
jgi:hypothetical protein